MRFRVPGAFCAPVMSEFTAYEMIFGDIFTNRSDPSGRVEDLPRYTINGGSARAHKAELEHRVNLR